jgi:hypothetical protein
MHTGWRQFGGIGKINLTKEIKTSRIIIGSKQGDSYGNKKTKSKRNRSQSQESHR